MATKRPMKMKTVRAQPKRPASKASGRKAARAKEAAVKGSERAQLRPERSESRIESAKAPSPAPRIEKSAPIEKKPGSLPVPSATFYF